MVISLFFPCLIPFSALQYNYLLFQLWGTQCLHWWSERAGGQKDQTIVLILESLVPSPVFQLWINDGSYFHAEAHIKASKCGESEFLGQWPHSCTWSWWMPTSEAFPSLGIFPDLILCISSSDASFVACILFSTRW